MIFNYLTKTFKDDFRNDRLTIEGIAMLEMSSEPVSFAMREDTSPEEASITKIENPILLFENGILKFFSGGERIRSISSLFFLMNESEVAAAQRNLYQRGYESAGEAISKKVVLTDVEKKTLQKAIDDLALANGIKLPENMGYFNDRLILYMYPFIRSMANSETNFHKVLEDLKHFTDVNEGKYKFPMELLDHDNLNDVLKGYLGTGSKEITKFIANRLVVKTDLVKSLSPELLKLLIGNSSKIFGISTETKILTSYEDIFFEVITYVKYVMDVFDNNVDYTQKYLNSKEKHVFTEPTLKIMRFLNSQFSPQKRMKLMTDSEVLDYQLRDVADQISKYDTVDKIPYKLRFEYPEGLRVPKNWKTLKELHDKVSADFNIIKAEDNNKTIPYTADEWAIHGMTKDNVELVLPSEGKTLVAWGADQQHCVASYADKAANKECIIMGVKVNGIHTYTVELRLTYKEVLVASKQMVVDKLEELPGLQPPERKKHYSFNIVQFYAKNNRRPEDLGDTKTRGIVRELLREALQIDGNAAFEEDGTYSYRMEFVAGNQENDAFDAMRYENIAVGDLGNAPVVINDVALGE
ncbi:MAG TPA: hypothetical protein DDY18_02875 [Flavobacterium sp.]|jgi:hypothetical protein|nr:hypothetical protein [Flavobacterium sp.]